MACVVDDDDARRLNSVVSELKSKKERSDSEFDSDDFDDLEFLHPFQDVESAKRPATSPTSPTRPTKPTTPATTPAKRPERPKFIPESEWADGCEFGEIEASDLFFKTEHWKLYRMKTDSNVTWFYAHEYPSGNNDKPMYVAIIFHGDLKNTYAYSMATRKKYSYDFTKSKITEESMPDEVYKKYETFYEIQNKNGKAEFTHTIKDKFTQEHKQWQGYNYTSRNDIHVMHKSWLKTFTKQEYPGKIPSRQKTKCKFSSR